MARWVRFPRAEWGRLRNARESQFESGLLHQSFVQVYAITKVRKEIGSKQSTYNVG